MKLRDILKTAREKKGYSQSKLAKILGYSSGQFISNWERGQSYPPVDRLAKMSLIFDLDHEELIKLYVLELGEEKKRAFKKALDFHLSRIV
jgi:transcriptional regulator with XRE-family HTH domain